MDDAQARRVQAWIDGYVQAWNSNDPADIRALFTQDAAYYTEPYGPPWEGRDEIVRQWLDRKDEPGQAQFSWHPLAVTSEVAVIQGEVAYPSEGHTYSNLWVIRLDTEGRCTEFTEWWMRHPQPDEPPVEPSNQR
jgi:ketosteroid isomerase-like protein